MVGASGNAIAGTLRPRPVRAEEPLDSDVRERSAARAAPCGAALSNGASFAQAPSGLRRQPAMSPLIRRATHISKHSLQAAQFAAIRRCVIRFMRSGHRVSHPLRFEAAEGIRPVADKEQVSLSGKTVR